MRRQEEAGGGCKRVKGPDRAPIRVAAPHPAPHLSLCFKPSKHYCRGHSLNFTQGRRWSRDHHPRPPQDGRVTEG